MQGDSEVPSPASSTPLHICQDLRCYDLFAPTLQDRITARFHSSTVHASPRQKDARVRLAFVQLERSCTTLHNGDPPYPWAHPTHVQGKRKRRRSHPFEERVRRWPTLHDPFLRFVLSERGSTWDVQDRSSVLIQGANAPFSSTCDGCFSQDPSSTILLLLPSITNRVRRSVCVATRQVERRW